MEKEDRMKMEVVVDGVSKRYGKVEKEYAFPDFDYVVAC